MMAWQIPESGSDLINLNTMDHLLVIENVAITVTGTIAARGYGRGHSVEIFGSIVGTAGGIWLGDPLASAANSQSEIYVGEGAHVRAIEGDAVAFKGRGNTLLNEGSISSKSVGASQWGEGAGQTDFVNRGTISGNTEAVRHYGTDTLVLTNSGLVTSKAYAYLSYDGTNIINNTGRMVGTVQFGDGADTYYGVNGRLSGTVFGGGSDDRISGGADNDVFYGEAGNDTLSGGAGNDFLDGGVDVDKMTGGGGNDTYVLDNAGDIVIEIAGGGTDLVQASVSWSMVANVEKITLTGAANIYALGNALGNVMTGNTGHNTLSGGAGNDAIGGGDGNDKLYGGTGNDTLKGGSGSDVFVFNTALSSSTNKDTIVDFNVAADTISLDNAIFTAVGTNGELSSAAFRIGTAAADASDRVIYNSSTGALIYDSNGSASGGAVQFAKLATGLALTNADFFII